MSVCPPKDLGDSWTNKVVLLREYRYWSCGGSSLFIWKWDTPNPKNNILKLGSKQLVSYKLIIATGPIKVSCSNFYDFIYSTKTIQFIGQHNV